MSASFLASVLEIEKGKTPDWKAAREHVKQLTVEEAVQTVLKTYQAVELADVSLERKDCRRRILHAIRYLEKSWSEHSLDLRGTTIFIFAGMSWGDSVEGMDEVTLLVHSGAAKAAGFLVGT